MAAVVLALGCGGTRPNPREDAAAPDAVEEDVPDAALPVAPPPSQSDPADGAFAESAVAPDALLTPDQALAPDAPSAVLISEIMYHPVLEDDTTDRHEFVELHNRSDAVVDLSGWKLAGEIDFTFPSGASIPAGGFLVVAKDRRALAAVPGYALAFEGLWGDYARELDNGGGLLALLDGQGVPVDSLRYDDEFPWPLAADALAAGQSWLPAALLPLESHRYRGVSLERVSYDLPASAIANWAPSPLDGATPGRSNNLTGTPPAILEALVAAPASGQPRIRAADEVLIRAKLSAQGTAREVQVEYFVDSLERTDEAHSLVPAAVTGLDLEARLPAQPDNSIVRYRILTDRGSGRAEVISPRASDPFAWHTYFVSPVIAAVEPPYQLFIRSADWGQLWTNIDHGSSSDSRVIPEAIGTETVRCRIRPSWDERVPAVLVHDGEVYDVRVRYQGSRWKRPYGRDIDLLRTTISPLPDPMMARPSPDGSIAPFLSALSWNIAFPRHHRLEGERESLIVNKLADACPGLSATVGELLYRAAGLPTGRARYRRFYVNGGYYAYMLDLEAPSESLLERHLAPAARVGDLVKASGNQGVEEGPWGRADLSPLLPSCDLHPPAYQPLTRYEYTYERKTWDWKDASDIRSLADGLDAARIAGHLDDNDSGNDDPAPVRSFLASTFDLDLSLTYLAIRNWSLPWDDFFHNHYLHRDDGGRWSILPWDLDLEFGEAYGWNAQRSFFIGEKGDPDGRDGKEWNPLKDAFLRGFRPEFITRLRQLDGSDPGGEDSSPPGRRGLLSPERWRSMVETAAARFHPGEAAASPVIGQCDFEAEKAHVLAFAEQRRAALADLVACASRPCGLTGEYFSSPSLAPETLAFRRTDQVVDFNWAGDAPAPGFPADEFGVRWTGRITPPATGSYTFATRSDDGVRLWLGTALLIDNWTVHPLETNTATVTLVGGVPYGIRLEYFEAGFDALVSLYWTGPGFAQQRVPSTQLQPGP